MTPPVYFGHVDSLPREMPVHTSTTPLSPARCEAALVITSLFAGPIAVESMEPRA